MNPRSLIPYIILGAVATPALLPTVVAAQPSSERPPLVLGQKSPRKPLVDRFKLIDSVASLNEDLVEQALADDVAKSTTTARSIAHQMPALKSVLSEAALVTLQSRLYDQQQALARGDMIAAALASVEMYRHLQESMDAHERGAPLQVPLLDYSGFKIMAQVRAPSPDWTAIQGSIAEMSSFWKELVPKIKDQGLRNLLSSIEAGLVEAQAKHDTAYSGFAAKMLLESVDLLEGQFKR